ncbi:MAPEG family protein [Microbulbifer agarilyticus]|uniref:MAPEG family protein n=1 Tax=Microbulbifer agarilyticus TaxID=260552 RepID=UPI001C9767FE|nr:MAPEG family protein [Microbulbifer agarilyticus]MBY6213268.1 MAPEG family protein [Microbulbifer agarilyticus]
MQQEIFGPVFTLMLLTWAVWMYMYAKRIPFVISSGLEPNQVTPEELARISPPEVSNPSDNLKNLFEVPVLFYALALYLFSVEQVDAAYVVGAWVYVLLRILHSGVHCTVNIVTLRFALYVLSSLVLFAMTLRAAIAYFI